MDRFMLLSTREHTAQMYGGIRFELQCTILKDESISLRVCTNHYGYARGYGKSVRGIKTPVNLISALNYLDSMECMEEIREEFTDYEILEKLFTKLPYLSIHAAVYIRFRERKLKEDLFKITYPFIKNVVIDIPTDFLKAVSIFDVIYNYVIVWIDENECFPVGKHRILNYNINFTNTD